MSPMLRAEWVKLRTVASTGWLLLGVVLVTVAASTVAASTAADAASLCTSSAGCQPDATRLTLTGTGAGQSLAAILAVLAVTGEYGTGMIRTTLAAVPRRIAVLTAKAAVAGGLTLVAGAVAVLGSVLAGEPILPGHGLSLPAGPMMRAATGTVLYLALIALLSLGVATAVRDAAVAIGTVLGLLYVFPILGQVIADPAWHRHLEQLGPMTAGLEIQASTGLNHLPIGPWAGLGVLAAWAAAALLAGGLLLRFRDA
jgi:ABC-2 type transport system permease protein